MEFILVAHSLWRWVVVVVALVALVKFGLGWLQKKSPEHLDRRIRFAFASVIDIQFLLGAVLLILYAISGVLLRPAIEHAVIMLVAVVLVHLSVLWSKNDATYLRNNFLVTLAVIVLIGIGVARVGGWTF